MPRPVDTLVIFYHPGAPGLHKRLRAEYAHPPSYVEASHPAAPLLDEEQTGWSVAALGFTPVTNTVYYWEEVLRRARSPRDVYNAAPEAYAKRLDLYIPSRLAKNVELAAIPTSGEEAGWRFQAHPSTTLLHTLYHIHSWASSLTLRKSGVIRLYAELSLAPPREAAIIARAARLTAYRLAAQGYTVEYAVYTAPQPPRYTRKTPIVHLERLEAELVEGPLDALRRATLDALRDPPGGTPVSARGPRAKTPREQARRLERLSKKLVAVAAGTAAAATWAAAAVASSETKPIETLQRLLAELVEADLENATLQKYQEGGLLAHNLVYNQRHLETIALLPALTLPLHRLPDPTPENLPELALQAPTPAAKPAALLAQLLAEAEAWTPAAPHEETCNPANAEKAAEQLAIHPSTLRIEGDRLRPDPRCTEEALKALLKR